MAMDREQSASTKKDDLLHYNDVSYPMCTLSPFPGDGGARFAALRRRMSLLDRYWNHAHRELVRHLHKGAKVLLPAGDWPKLPFDTTFYFSTDCNLAIDSYDGVLIHKGMLASFRQADIRVCLKDLCAVSANNVFVLFVQRPRALVRTRGIWPSFHQSPLKVYANPAMYHRRNLRRCAFMHIPKAGGTSIWSEVANAVPANIYFTSNETLAAFEGDLDAFEAVGGHINAETLVAKGWTSPVFFVLRDPMQRVLSFINHAQRADANLGMLVNSFHTARRITNGPFDESLRDLLIHEGNLQVRMLGARPGEAVHDCAVQDAIWARACARLGSRDWPFALLEDVPHMARQVAAHFGTRGLTLRHDNRSPPGQYREYDEQIRRFLLSDEARCHDVLLYQRAVALHAATAPD